MPREVHGFLEDLGRRLREARERAGRSLTDVAQEAAISRRYLTEAEAGRANASVLVLARLAEALGTPLGELLATPARPPQRVALVGLRGAGKSTVGRLLAQRMECPFVELDRRIEERAGLSLAEVFDLHGAAGFHRWEARALEGVLAQGERSVIATGGSIVAAGETFERLKATCRTVWLKARPEEHFERVVDQGDRRPMGDDPRAMDELRTILSRREPLYATCELAVDTTGRTPAAVCAEVLERTGLAEL